MKSKTLLSIIAAAGFAFSNVALAGSAKTYQVTRPVLEMNDTMIAVLEERTVGRLLAMRAPR